MSTWRGTFFPLYINHTVAVTLSHNQRRIFREKDCVPSSSTEVNICTIFTFLYPHYVLSQREYRFHKLCWISLESKKK